jgi:hypothetical protein
MALPGFTAEAGVGPTKHTYRLTNGYGIGVANVYSQSNGDGLEGAEPEDGGVEDEDITGDGDEGEMDDESEVW